MAGTLRYKTGLLPSPEPPRLKFGTYLLPQALPPTPAVFGHQDLYPARGWGMLANDKIGDCTVAGAMHVCMLWRAIAGNRIQFSNLDAQDDYSDITGYRPGKKSTDTGADMVTVAKYWQQTGFRDYKANRHKILAYLGVDQTRLDYVDTACHLFKAVGLGIGVSDEDEQAFIYRQPWDDPSGDIVGLHYVPMIGKDANYRYVVTWGGLQPVTQRWFEARVSESIVMLSDEYLIGGKSEEGFDVEKLTEDLELFA